RQRIPRRAGSPETPRRARNYRRDQARLAAAGLRRRSIRSDRAGAALCRAWRRLPVGRRRARSFLWLVRAAHGLPRGFGAAGDRQGFHRRFRPAGLCPRRRSLRRAADRGSPFRHGAGRLRGTGARLRARAAGRNDRSGRPRESRHGRRRLGDRRRQQPRSPHVQRVARTVDDAPAAAAVWCDQSGGERYPPRRGRGAVDGRRVRCLPGGRVAVAGREPESAARRDDGCGAAGMMKPQVKVCGITTVHDARFAVELGAAYLGLNFYTGSPRFLSVELAREIADAVEGRAVLVGVFVNAPSAEVQDIADAVGLDLLQFHGDETPEALAPFAERAIKAFRGATDEADRFEQVGGFLFDAPTAAPNTPL